MPRSNDAVAALMQEYADLTAITGGQAFRVRTYEKAARSIGGYHEDLADLDRAGLRKIPNVGDSIADKIIEFLASGTIAAVEKLRAKIPPGVLALTEISGLGPKKALALYEELGIASVEQLEEALDANRLDGLPGFGAKTIENIHHGIALLHASGGRVLISTALEMAEDIVAALSQLEGVERCTYAGSLRRMRETIGDVDILAASLDPAPVMATFAELPLVAEVIARGEKKTSIRTVKGFQVDLRVVPPDSWGAALQYFTGSKEHNVRIREMAVRKKLKLSEYGLFHAENDELIVSQTEAEVYERLGLPWIPPTLREDRGEVAAALKDELPVLVTEADLRGDLHTHTTLTDGIATLEEMVAVAATRGYEYYAITDHAPDLFMQRMTDEKMLKQREQVKKLAAKYPKMVLLHGTELNIGPDGAVDWPADFLAGFDICVASVHSLFNQPVEEMTARFVRACENPYVHVIGHPFTRLIGQRPPVDADVDEVFKAAARTGTALEINAAPDRLDLSDEHVLRAKRHGVKFAIDSDAHSTLHLPFMRYGIGVAQRAWLTPDDVINTWPLDQLRAFLRKGRPA